MQRLGSLREAAQVGDGDESARVTKVDIHHALLSLQSDHFNGANLVVFASSALGSQRRPDERAQTSREQETRDVHRRPAGPAAAAVASRGLRLRG
ncbi:MAG: hypothetical protein JO090_05560 [Rhizobacter sp.]|nr:hypothetical protein [Rhizobacter sp.]